MPAGSIVVDLLLKTGSFETDTARASKTLQNEFKAISSSVQALAGVFGVYLSASAFKDFISGSIEAEAHLNDLSKKTGIAADTLGGIGFAAKQSGSDLDSASAAAGKLNKSLAEAAAGNETAAEAFKVLGINVKDAAGNTKTADTALSEIATKFASYADGPEKAALALRLFGKAGADIIPLLDEGGAKLRENIEFYKQYSGVTNDTAKAANDFESTLTHLSLIQGAFGKELAQAFLPTLQDIAEAFLDMKKNSDAMASAADGLGQLFAGLTSIFSGFAFVIYQTAKGIGAIAAASDAFEQASGAQFDGFAISTDELMKAGDAYKAAAGPLKEFGADFDDAANKAANFQKKIMGTGDAAQASANAFLHSNAGYGSTGGKPPAPRLAAIATGPKDDPTKKLLDAQLKAIQGQIDREKDLLQTRNQFLDLYNSQNLLSLKDYYGARQASQDDATKAEVDGYTREIAALRAFQAKSTTSKVDSAGAEVKITELVDKRAKAELDAGKQSILLSEQARFAAEALEKQFQSVNAQVLELQENFAGAAAIKFDLQNADQRRTFTSNLTNSDPQLAAAAAKALKDSDALRAAAIAQGVLQKATTDATRAAAFEQATEDALTASFEAGHLTTIELLSKEGDARKALIPAYEAQVAALKAIADASGTDADLLHLAQAKVALDKLKASVDPLAASLNKTFGDDFNSALDDFVTGTKSATDAFHAFAKSVLNDILKMGSKSITEQIFGGSGGAGGFLSDLFSRGSAASSAGGAASGLAGALKGAFGGAASPPLKFDTSGTGIDASASGFNAAQDSQKASDALTQSQQDLIVATDGQATAAAASTQGLQDAAAALGPFSGAAAAAAQALTLFSSSSSSSSGASWLGKLLGSGSSTGGYDLSGTGSGAADGFTGATAFADGTNYVPRDGMRAILHKGEAVVPAKFNPAAGGSSPASPTINHHYNITVQGAPNQSRDSAMQQGAAIGLGIQRAMARNT